MAVATTLGLQKCGIAHIEKGKVVQLGNSKALEEGELKEVKADTVYR